MLYGLKKGGPAGCLPFSGRIFPARPSTHHCAIGFIVASHIQPSCPALNSSPRREAWSVHRCATWRARAPRIVGTKHPAADRDRHAIQQQQADHSDNLVLEVLLDGPFFLQKGAPAPTRQSHFQSRREGLGAMSDPVKVAGRLLVVTNTRIDLLRLLNRAEPWRQGPPEAKRWKKAPRAKLSKNTRGPRWWKFPTQKVDPGNLTTNV